MGIEFTVGSQFFRTQRPIGRTCVPKWKMGEPFNNSILIHALLGVLNHVSRSTFDQQFTNQYFAAGIQTNLVAGKRQLR